MNDVLVTLTLLMESKGLSEYKLAQLTGVSQSTINSFFKKNNIPSVYTLQSLCDGLGLTLSEFFSLTERLSQLVILKPQATPNLNELMVSESTDEMPLFNNQAMIAKYSLLTPDKQAIVESIIDAFLKA